MSDLASHTIVVNVAEIVYTVSLGSSTAVGMRLGNHLGAYKPGMALTSSRVSITITFKDGWIDHWHYFVADQECSSKTIHKRQVISLASALIPQLALFSLFDFTQGTPSVVLRGAGHEQFGAITNLVAYYIIDLPVFIPLTLKISLRVPGRCCGMILSAFFQSVVFMIKNMDPRLAVRGKEGKVSS